MVSASVKTLYVIDETPYLYRFLRFVMSSLILRKFTFLVMGVTWMWSETELISELMFDFGVVLPTPIYEVDTLQLRKTILVATMVGMPIAWLLYGLFQVSRLLWKPRYIPQKVKVGSELIPPTPVAFQGMIKTCGGSLVGQFFRYNSFFITAAHVVEAFTSEFIMVHGDKAVMVKPSEFELMDGDLAVLKIPPGNPLACMPSCKLVQNFPLKNSGLFVSVRSEVTASVGLLEPDDAFGFVRYSGSTVSGYSGAPYCSGRSVYGMHLGGGAYNMGLDSAFIIMMLTKFNESSEDYFLDQIKRHSKLFYQRSPYDPDEYRVRSGNSYHIVSGDVMEKLLGTGFVEYEGESTIDRPPLQVKVPLAPQQNVAPVAQLVVKEAVEEVTGSDILPSPTRDSQLGKEVIEITLPVSKNLTRPQQPDAAAGATGQALAPSIAHPLSNIPSFAPESVSLSPSPNSASPTQTLVQPSAALNGMSGSMSELQNLLMLHLMMNLNSSLKPLNTIQESSSKLLQSLTAKVENLSRSANSSTQAQKRTSKASRKEAQKDTSRSSSPSRSQR